MSIFGLSVTVAEAAMSEIEHDLPHVPTFTMCYEHKTGAELAGCSKHTVFEVLCFHREFGAVKNLHGHYRGGLCTLD